MLTYSTTIINNIVNRTQIVSANWSVTVYAGAQPTATDFITNWTSYRTSFLAHWNPFTWSQPDTATYNRGDYLQILSYPGAQVAVNTGTVSWGVLWANSSNSTVLQNSANVITTSFILCPAGDFLSNAVIRFANANIVSGQTYPLQDIIFLTRLATGALT